MRFGNEDMTIACWIYADANNVNHDIVSKWNSSGSDREYLLTADTSANIIFNTSSTGVNGFPVTSSTSLVTGEWMFVVAWHDNAGNNFIQVNNGAVDSVAADAAINAGNSDFTIGALSASPSAG